jgi:putative PIN family toxin of toxin-antitoxin system
VLKNNPRVFLDTNIIFSGLYSAHGAPGIILERFIRGSIDVVISRQVLDEVIRVVKDKLPDAIPFLTEFLLNAQPEIVLDPEPESIKHWSRYLSPGDASILAAAINAKPDYFITGDNHFLENQELKKLVEFKIITSAEFLQLQRDL